MQDGKRSDTPSYREDFRDHGSLWKDSSLPLTKPSRAPVEVWMSGLRTEIHAFDPEQRVLWVCADAGGDW